MVSSYYPVFAGPSFAQQELLEKYFSMKVEHHLKDEKDETRNHDYYVMVDQKGNHLDVYVDPSFQSFGFYGMRINTDDMEECIRFITAAGYSVTVGPMEFPKSTFAILEAPGCLRYIIYQHKKA